MSIGQALIAIGESSVDPTSSIKEQGRAYAQAVQNMGALNAQVMTNASNQFVKYTDGLIKKKEESIKQSYDEYQLAKEQVNKAGATGYKNDYLKTFAIDKQTQINALMIEMQNTSSFKKGEIKAIKSKIDLLVNDVESASNDVIMHYDAYLDLQKDIDAGELYEFEAQEKYKELSNPSTPPLSGFKLREQMSDYIRRVDEMNEYFNDEVFKKMDDNAFTINAQGEKVRNTEINEKLYSMYNDTPEGIRAIESYQRSLLSGDAKTYRGINDMSTILSEIDSEVLLSMETPENKKTLDEMAKLKASISTELGKSITNEELETIMRNPQLVNLASDSLKTKFEVELKEYNSLKSSLDLNYVDVGQIYDLYNPEDEGRADENAQFILGMITNEQFDKNPNNQNNIPLFINFLRENKETFGETKVNNTIALITDKLGDTLPEAITEYSYSRFSNKSYRNAKKDFETKAYRKKVLASKTDDVETFNLNPQEVSFGDSTYSFDAVVSPSSNAKIGIPGLINMVGTDGVSIGGPEEKDRYMFFDGGYVLGSVNADGYVQSPDGTEEPAPGIDVKEVNKVYRAIEKDKIIQALVESQSISVEDATTQVESGNVDVNLLDMLSEKSEYFFVNQSDLQNFNVSSQQKKFINKLIDEGNKLNNTYSNSNNNKYSADVEAAIQAFANSQKITREQAIKLLKENNKL